MARVLRFPVSHFAEVRAETPLPGLVIYVLAWVLADDKGETDKDAVEALGRIAFPRPFDAARCREMPDDRLLGHMLRRLETVGALRRLRLHKGAFLYRRASSWRLDPTSNPTH